MLEIKSWSYEGLTIEMERQIATLMRSARATASVDIRQAYQRYAYGAFMAWSSITKGGLPEDFERLEKLTTLELMASQPKRRKRLGDAEGINIQG